ncbi:oxygen-independent coproporphyrinogen-3 oxidase [Prevotella sp. khp1]|uniref:radical SAM family heme chaperone HemW n=1 Tax=Prevotellaceae TaxID=171552 RepID=UPI000888D599|nr:MULTISPECIES: radical SAM family heme chaperone HemW [Prevotellaceae]QVJ81445.1 radical SAM family heme chaperone HemW [Xylanibacter ruminicola]SDQ61249.1 oxygen-independent coproporphyrinogen-3 oxidase [Prevotella sp. khp1]
MAGLYVHIPFCSSRCVYCGFYSTTGLALRERYVDALCQEIKMRSLPTTPPQKEGSLGTIYLGGGTPSQLTIPQLRRIFDAIYIYNKVENDAEVTIEVNPDDVTPELAAALQQLPINRVSMGAQTFNDERLHFLRRRHSSAQVHQAVATLRQAGFQNISIDLMYGFPNQTLEEWQADIDEALQLNVEHISTYCLMYEEGTPLYRLLEQGKVAEIDEELERKMYFTLINNLESAGYEHYEISNFARPGYRSRHNSSYWKGIPYIGIGAAAHSFDIQTRSWNVADIQQYITAMEQGERCFEAETLDEDTRYNDAVTVALRTCEGLDLSTLTDQQRTYCLKNAQRHLEAGLLKLNDQKISLTKEGLFVSDMIMSDLMLV